MFLGISIMSYQAHSSPSSMILVGVISANLSLLFIAFEAARPITPELKLFLWFVGVGVGLNVISLVSSRVLASRGL